MGPRPLDFDEESLKASPTYQRWLQLPIGGKLRYSCRDFVKGKDLDDERLLRRIMIARRNNLRDHDTLKKARQTLAKPKRTDDEMDVEAVEATRSYRHWASLPEGTEFVYNQKYLKGKEGHDHLLRKNIWRRMRYRRENKHMLRRWKETLPLAAVEAAVAAAVTMEFPASAEATLAAVGPEALDAAAQLAAAQDLKAEDEEDQEDDVSSVNV